MENQRDERPNHASTPRSGAVAPILAYRSSPRLRRRLTVGDIAAAIIAISLAIVLLSLAITALVGACMCAGRGDPLGLLAFFFFVFLLGMAMTAASAGISIMRGENRAPEEFQDSSGWRDTLTGIFTGTIGTSLLIILIFLVPRLGTDDTDKQNVVILLFVNIAALIVAVVCLLHSLAYFGAKMKR
jgi:MFS family permease